jgi:hypothetical protein
MREIIVAIVLATGLGLAAAATEIDWETTAPMSGTVEDGTVEVEGPGTFPLLSIDDPDVGGTWYEVSGDVAYEGVEGAGYLEMWSYFDDGGAYFSRTLAEEGPLAALTGTSEVRPFVLPFQLLNGAEPPIRIEINVVLSGGGRVAVGPLTVNSEAGGSVGAWWSSDQAGLLGAALGSFFGLLGAFVGVVGGLGKARRVVRGALWLGLLLGVTSLAIGGIALVRGQPQHVWYPLLLIGIIATVLDAMMLPTMQRATEAREFQRMKALDAR